MPEPTARRNRWDNWLGHAGLKQEKRSPQRYRQPCRGTFNRHHNVDCRHCRRIGIGTPPEIVARIQADAAKGLRSPQMTAKVQEQGFEVIGSTSAEAQAFVAAEIERWSKVVRDAGLKAD